MNLYSYRPLARGEFTCDIDVFYDNLTSIIHVFDNKVKGTTYLTNGIDSVQEKIVSKLGLEGAIDDYIWYLYHTDGIVSHFTNGGFKFFDKTNVEISLHTAFVERLKGR